MGEVVIAALNGKSMSFLSAAVSNMLKIEQGHNGLRREGRAMHVRRNKYESYWGTLALFTGFSIGCSATLGDNGADGAVSRDIGINASDLVGDGEMNIACVNPRNEICHVSRNMCLESYFQPRILDCLGSGIREPSLAETPSGVVLAYSRETTGGTQVETYFLDSMGTPLRPATPIIANARSPHLTWRDNNLIVVTTEGTAQRRLDVTAWDLAGNVVWDRHVDSSAPIEIATSAMFNGRSWIVAWRTSVNVLIGEVNSESIVGWTSIGVRGGAVAIAVDAMSGRTWLAIENHTTASILFRVFGIEGGTGVPFSADADGFHRTGPINLTYSPFQDAVVAAGYSLLRGHMYFTIYTVVDDVHIPQRIETYMLANVGGNTAITVEPLIGTLNGGYFSTYSWQDHGWRPRFSTAWSVSRQVGCSVLGGSLAVPDTLVLTGRVSPTFAVVRTNCGYLSVWDNGDMVGGLYVSVGTQTR